MVHATTSLPKRLSLVIVQLTTTTIACCIAASCLPLIWFLMNVPQAVVCSLKFVQGPFLVGACDAATHVVDALVEISIIVYPLVLLLGIFGLRALRTAILSTVIAVTIVSMTSGFYLFSAYVDLPMAKLYVFCMMLFSISLYAFVTMTMIHTRKLLRASACFVWLVPTVGAIVIDQILLLLFLRMPRTVPGNVGRVILRLITPVISCFITLPHRLLSVSRAQNLSDRERVGLPLLTLAMQITVHSLMTFNMGGILITGASLLLSTPLEMAIGESLLFRDRVVLKWTTVGAQWVHRRLQGVNPVLDAILAELDWTLPVADCAITRIATESTLEPSIPSSSPNSRSMFELNRHDTYIDLSAPFPSVVTPITANNKTTDATDADQSMMPSTELRFIRVLATPVVEEETPHDYWRNYIRYRRVAMGYTLATSIAVPLCGVVHAMRYSIGYQVILQMLALMSLQVTAAGVRTAVFFAQLLVTVWKHTNLSDLVTIWSVVEANIRLNAFAAMFVSFEIFRRHLWTLGIRNEIFELEPA